MLARARRKEESDLHTYVCILLLYPFTLLIPSFEDTNILFRHRRCLYSRLLQTVTFDNPDEVTSIWAAIQIVFYAMAG
jgi:hypothetical protein